MDLLPAFKYIEYLLFSRHRSGHGIHSPFVFRLVSETFRNKIDPDIVFKIEMIRKKMISSHGSIEVNDLGSGSKRMKTSIRKVSDIARYSAVSKKYGIFLSNMSATFGKPLVIELGTSLGISAMYLASSCKETKVITVEGCRETSEIALENFQEAGFSNIRLINSSFDEVFPRLKQEKVNPGLVFVDGNHRGEPLMRYFDLLVELSSSDTVVVFDDINSSREMSEAWNKIKNCNEVTFTVDIFRMGIVFFKGGIGHYHYVIRY